MSDFAIVTGLLLLAAVAAITLIFSWPATRSLGWIVRRLIRGGLAALVIVPVLMMFVVGTGWFGTGGSPPPAAESTSAKPAPKKSAERPDGGEVAEAEPEPVGAGEPPAEKPGEGSATRGLGDDDEPRSAAPEATPEDTPEAGAEPPADGEGEGAFDVMPVFYGTDRAQAAVRGRRDYGFERGRRLELGRALVTIPKSHAVPQIERPWSMRIPFIGVEIGESEDPNEHFTMKEVQALSERDFLTLAGQRLAASTRYRKHALIFVHGYNTMFDFAIYRTAQIAYDLKFDGAPFAYSWPSGGGVLDYTADRENSDQSMPYLKEFIAMVLEKSGAEAVSLIAHSMGNQPVLRVLKDLKAAKPAGVVFHQIILAAPDFDRDGFANVAKEIKGLANGVTLYASKNDWALAASRKVNGGLPRAGDVPDGGPLVTDGVDTIDITSVSTDSLGLNHSGYAENNELLTDVRLLVETGVRPPDKRVPTTKRIETAAGPYWEFVPPPAVP